MFEITAPAIHSITAGFYCRLTSWRISIFVCW